MSKAPVSDRIVVEPAPEGEGIDNFDWTEAVADHPETDDVDHCAAFEFIGVKTSLTNRQLDESKRKMIRLGFLVPVGSRAARRRGECYFAIPAPEHRAA